jgi:hypothetical protein
MDRNIVVMDKWKMDDFFYAPILKGVTYNRVFSI